MGALAPRLRIQIGSLSSLQWVYLCQSDWHSLRSFLSAFNFSIPRFSKSSNSLSPSLSLYFSSTRTPILALAATAVESDSGSQWAPPAILGNESRDLTPLRLRVSANRLLRLNSASALCTTLGIPGAARGEVSEVGKWYFWLPHRQFLIA